MTDIMAQYKLQHEQSRVEGKWQSGPSAAPDPEPYAVPTSVLLWSRLHHGRPCGLMSMQRRFDGKHAWPENKRGMAWSDKERKSATLELPLSAAHGTALPVGALRIDPFDDAVHVEGVAADTQEVTGGYRAKGKKRWEEGTHTGSTHQECKSLPLDCVHVRGYAIPALSPDNGAIIAGHLAIGTTPVEWKPMKGRGGWSVPHGKSMAKCG